MIRQHIYRKSKTGYRTVAASMRRQTDSWLSIAEQQVGLHYQSDLEAPAYYQYAAGGALVLSQCTVDPNGTRGSFLAHQLFVEDEKEARALFAARPLSRTLFCSAYVERGEEIEPLPTLSVPEMSEESLSTCFRTLDTLFGENRKLLAAFLCALQRTASDKERLVLVECDQRPQMISEQGRQLMELMMRALPYETARRLSYCTYLPKPGYSLSYAVSFIRPSGLLSQGLRDMAIRFHFPTGDVICPEGYILKPTRRDEEIASALLAHDLNWVDRARGGEASVGSRHAAPTTVNVPPFDESMSLRQYVRDWAQEIEVQAARLNEQGLRTYTRQMWPSLMDQLIAASLILKDNEEFLAGMGGAIAFLRKERKSLCLEADMLADAATVLLDSINWQELELTRATTRKLLIAATGYAVLLPEGDPVREGALLAHYALQFGENSLKRGLASVSSLCAAGSGQLVRVQECLGRYARTLCPKLGKHPPMDDAFVTLVMLSCTRYVNGIPDFRAYSSFHAFVTEQYGAKEAHAFENRFQALKRQMGVHTGSRGLSKESRMLFGLTLLLLLAMAVFLVIYFVGGNT